MLIHGAQWALKKGFGWKEDIEHTETRGALEGANPDKVSKRALQRGRPQLGTLGAGNHFLEIQVVQDIYDREAAKIMGIDDVGQVTVIHSYGLAGIGLSSMR